MACDSCTDRVVSLASIYSTYNAECQEDVTCKSGIGAECVKYNGANLSCSTINTGDNLETALIKIDAKLCSTLGDYSTYNMACLTNSTIITTEKGFVEAMSSAYCIIKSQFDSFINTTFTAYQTDVTNRFTAITSPNIVCSSANIIANDTLSGVYAKYCTKFAAIDTALSLSTVNWSQCYSVPTPPATIAEGFSLVLGQICAIKSSGANPTLPTFNNVGSCLATPTTADTLVDTINKIKAKVCTAPAFDINALTWGCMTKPSNVTTNLQDAFQVLLNKVTTLSQNLPTFSGDFAISPVDAGNPCSGKTVSLSSSPYVDRYVKATSSDPSGGTLQDKLQAGANASLDYSTVGKVIIGFTGGGSTDEKTKASAPGTAGFLDQKITGGSTSIGLSITTPYDAGTDKIIVTPQLDLAFFADKLLDIIKNTPDLLTKFCLMVKACPSPCSAPSNVVVTMEP